MEAELGPVNSWDSGDIDATVNTVSEAELLVGESSLPLAPPTVERIEVDEYPNIVVHAANGKLKGSPRAITRDTVDLAKSISKEYEAKLESLLLQPHSGYKSFDPLIADQLKAMNWLKPRFDIGQYEALVYSPLLESDLKQVIFSKFWRQYYVPPDAVLTIFRLPHFLNDCRKNFERKPRSDVRFGYPGGLFYKHTIDLVRQAQRDRARKHDIKLERLNRPADHRTDKYYYIWRVLRQR